MIVFHTLDGINYPFALEEDNEESNIKMKILVGKTITNRRNLQLRKNKKQSPIDIKITCFNN